MPVMSPRFRLKQAVLTALTAPVITAVSSGNQSLIIYFIAPEGNGGSAITNYQYSVNNGSTFTTLSPASTSNPITIAGLTNGTTYTVRIRAVNSIGPGTQSNSVIATPGLPVSGALLWLACDNGVFMTGSNVSVWADLSGNGINFGAKPNSALPLRHSDSSIKFTASATYNDANARVMQNTSNAGLLDQTGLYTLFAVVRAGANNSCIISKSTDQTKRRRYQISVNNGTIYALEGNGDIYTSYNTLTGDQVNLKRLIVSQIPTSGQIILRYNGTQVSLLNSINVSGTTTNTAPVYLGASPFSPGSTYNAEASTEMYIYEIVLYQSVLTLAQIQQVESYLNSKWSVY